MPWPGRLQVLLPFLLLLPLAACRDEAAPATGPESAAVDASERPTQQFFDYKLVETHDGIPKWILVSQQMNKYTGQRDVELITVHIDFYKDGSHFSTLTADSGRANLMTHDIYTWGNVVVTTEDGRRLDTEELYFDSQKEIIHNAVHDLFTREDDMVEGIGLEASPDLEYIEIKNQVEADVVDSPAGSRHSEDRTESDPQ